MDYLYNRWVFYDGEKSGEFYFDKFIYKEIDVIEGELDEYGHNLVK